MWTWCRRGRTPISLEKRKPSLSWWPQARNHTHILRYTPREAQIRPGRSSILSQERHTLETDQVHVRTCQINGPREIWGLALSSMYIWMGALFVFRYRGILCFLWELIKHLLPYSEALQVCSELYNVSCSSWSDIKKTSPGRSWLCRPFSK